MTGGYSVADWAHFHYDYYASTELLGEGDQGRSCKQICWPPGFDGLQRVGLDPGQYDHHPHGVVHVGKEQDV